MLDHVVDLEPTTSTDSPLLPLEVDGLVFEADGKPLIDRLDLTLSGSGTTVIMGPNGAGKSLLLRLLHGLIEPHGGEIRWGGARLDGNIRKRQAMVFQSPVLLRRSVAANIDFVLRLSGKRGKGRRAALLAQAGLADHARQPARLLSGGEQQRLALARALALEPEVLLLDEPTASLDPASVSAFETIVLAAHAQGTKILFVTHDVGQARRLADDMVFLHKGRIVEHTAGDAFFAAPASREARDYLAGRLVL